MENIFIKLENKVLNGEFLSFQEADTLYSTGEDSFMRLLASASRIRQHYRKDKISLCSITNARSGKCNEDCVFCSQSARHNTDIDVYPLISEKEMLRRAREAAAFKTNRFCVVTSGRSAGGAELDVICGALVKIRKEFPDLRLDASLGILSEKGALKLKKAGLDRYNHNLETAKSNFASICTTHTYEDRVKTVKLVKDCGIQICCGGIIGLGETKKQRIELAFELRGLDIDSLPLNFLNPIANTRLADNQPLSPIAILKTIALFRFILPAKEIRICGGRQANLRNLQPLIFMAGADAIIIGNYLTTKGSAPQDDIQMIEDLGLRIQE